MNIEERLAPEREVRPPGEPERRPERPLAILAVVLLLLGLWAVLTMPKPPENCRPRVGSRYGSGQGSAHRGTGGGSDEHGDGGGSGQNGRHAGRERETTLPGGQSMREERHGQTAANGQADESGQPTGLPSVTISQEELTRAEAVPFRAPRKPRGLTERAQTRGDIQTAGSAGLAGTRGFYGVTVSANERALFLVDVSGSMGAVSADGGRRMVTRLAILKEELKKALGAEKGQGERRSGSFMMIAFNHHTRQFPKKKLCRYGERREMKEAVEFIDGLTAGGGTNMRPAWQLALQEIKRHGITTVYFLTDGEDGEGLQAPELLGMIHAEAPRGLVVHCFAIGRDQKFMEEVAKARKGRYVYRP